MMEYLFFLFRSSFEFQDVDWSVIYFYVGMNGKTTYLSPNPNI